MKKFSISHQLLKKSFSIILFYPSKAIATKPTNSIDWQPEYSILLYFKTTLPLFVPLPNSSTLPRATKYSLAQPNQGLVSSHHKSWFWDHKISDMLSSLQKISTVINRCKIILVHNLEYLNGFIVSPTCCITWSSLESRFITAKPRKTTSI